MNEQMLRWHVSYSYLANVPDDVMIPAGYTDGGPALETWVNNIADEARKRGLAIGELRFEGYTDECHVFHRARNGRWVRFMNIQCEG